MNSFNFTLKGTYNILGNFKSSKALDSYEDRGRNDPLTYPRTFHCLDIRVIITNDYLDFWVGFCDKPNQRSWSYCLSYNPKETSSLSYLHNLTELLEDMGVDLKARNKVISLFKSLQQCKDGYTYVVESLQKFQEV